uniref:Uncharacterized protein n=1 Tax=Periophthalmus magnuspinnatus TaxID=409849 RepID=A0A3B3ZCM4_9GOBI
MHDLTAQVTSSLLPFPGVTLNALGEDEITLDSVLQGKFTVGRSGLAWLACGPHLEAVHAVTGERLSAYTFSGGGEHPPCILAAKDFSWLKRSGLLIGLEEAEGSVLCLYDLGLSRVVKAVVIPGRVTIEPLVSYGGASTSTQHLHQSLRWFFGIAAVGTDLGHVLLVDLCLDDLSCSQSELEASDLQVVTKSPAEIPKLREVSSREGRHLCLQLNGATGVGATALQYISRTNQLAVGFSDGYLHLWNMKTLKKEYHSQLEGGKVPVNAFTFQEPENDPRNCCYLWAVQSSQDLEGDIVSLRLLQLAFSERKCSASGKILYEGLEYCEERYSQELSGTAFPLRAQATNTRLLSCQTIEKFRPHHDRDDSMNEVSSPDTSVSIFMWQVKAYGQGTPATFIGVFDINRWYHAQMPDSLRAGESLQNCPYLAVWSLDTVMQMVSPNVLLDVLVNDRSLSRGLPYTCPPPEQYFNPTTYNFDATCLLNTGIVHLTCSGYQKETLSFLKKAAPCSSEVISTSYSRCLVSGLLSSRLADSHQSSSLTQEEQLDAILCTAVETSSLGLITGCIKQWTAEGETTVYFDICLNQTGWHLYKSLSYAQVVLWFCRTGLLPEGSDEDALQISRPFYSHSIISSYYTIRREELKRLAKGKWCADCLMIDGLVDQCGERLVNLWKRDEEGTGQYPPPTLHALLDIYLLDNIDEATKHAIVIYLLLDVMYAFSNKEGASVESFPTAFAIPIGLVKLIQGLWLLDHHDHQSAFELLLHPAASQCQFEWQHERVLQALMCQGQHTEALRYLHVTKPAMASTSQAKLCLSVLLHNRCLIEAWSLVRQHSNRLNISELLGFLYETCQELGLIKELLKLPLGLSEQEGLEKFLQGTGGLQNRELLMVHYLQQANYIPALQLNHSLKMNLVVSFQSNTRNSILDQYGKVLPRVQRKLAMERSKPYQRPLTIHKEVSRPQPLSTITKRSASEKVISRAGFINNVLTKIEEVWIGKGDSPQPFPAKRLMKLVVQPSCQMPEPLLSPPRPPSSWVSPKSVSKAPELCLLQTPQVVKRARALAASGPMFAAFTPQSILRSSLRPTPVATPSASPGRSITPPPRKENRITFIEEEESPEIEKNIRWTNGVSVQVVMVHLGTDEGEMDQDEEVAQAASFLELQPSTTLLVPLELVEGQDALVNASEQVPNDIFQTDVPNDHKTESQSSFSLTLDLEEDVDKEPEPNLENNLLSTGVLHTEMKGSTEEAVTISELQVVEKVETKSPETEVLVSGHSNAFSSDTPIESKVQEPKEEALPENILENEQTENTEEAQVKEGEVEQEETEMQPKEHKVEVLVPTDELSEVCKDEEMSQVQDEEVLEAPVRDEEVPEAPVRDEKVPEAPVRDEEVPEARVRDEEVPEAPVRDEEVPEAPVRDEEVPEAPVRDEEVPEAPVQDEEVPEAPVQDEEISAVLASEDELSEVCKDEDGEIPDAPVQEELVEGRLSEPSDEEPLKEDPLSSNIKAVQAAESEQATTSVDAPQDKKEETDSREEEKETQRRGRSKKQEPVVAPVEQVDDVPEEQPVLETPGSGRKNKAPYTPTRRTTRASRAVTFIYPVPEETHDEEGKPEQEVDKEHEQEPTVAVATSPGRSTRRSKQAKENIIGTPRRSTRRTQPEPKPEPEAPVEQKEVKVENVSDNTVSSTTRTLSPGRKRGSERNSSRTSKQSRSEEVEASPESEVKQEVADTNVVAKSSGRGKTPSKRKAAQSTTPRRSSRRNVSMNEDAPQLLEILEEVEEQELISTTPAKQSSRKMKAVPTLLTAVEEENDKLQTPSLGRTTRQSNRMTLSVYPQVSVFFQVIILYTLFISFHITSIVVSFNW